jgi:carbonic anhydrase
LVFDQGSIAWISGFGLLFESELQPIIPRGRMFPERLTAGYRSFLGGRFADERNRYEMLAERGQRPEIMVFGCVDSRVSPEVIFDASPGELLVVRNVANLVPAYDPHRESQAGTSAALEFGVQALRVKHIVVLGHAYCGGIRAFADDREPLSPGDFIGRWMSQIAPAAESLGPRPIGEDEGYLRRLEFASVELSLRNLMTFPCVRILVERGKLTLHGAYFGVATGRLLVRDPGSGQFEPVVDGMPARVPMIHCS